MRKLINYACIGAAVVFASCDKTTEYSPAGFGPASAVTGVVIATDEFQAPLPADQQPSVDIAIASEDAQGSTGNTSAQGGTRYSIPNIQGGTYSITYTAAGFSTITRPNVNHGGGNETSVDTTYLIKQSTTEITAVSARFKDEVTTTKFDAVIAIPANTDFTVPNDGDSLIFISRQTSPNTRIYIPPGTVLNFPKDSVIFNHTIINDITTFLEARVTLNTPTEQGFSRGALLVVSADAEPTAENYMLIQTKLQNYIPPRNTGNPPTPIPRDTLTIKVPFSLLEARGIITTTNRRAHVAAYGISGTMFAYGSALTADRLFFLYPTRNPNRSVVAAVDR